jgi:hypothetical protein
VQISNVQQSLEDTLGQIQALCEQATPQERIYVTALHQYTAALLQSVLALNVVVNRLKRKMDGEPYGMSAYKADVVSI